MPIAFWYWLGMVIWFFYGGGIVYRRRSEGGPLYLGAGWSLLLFILLVIVGVKLFPSPFKTLVSD